jgi:hypothetical protein
MYEKISIEPGVYLYVDSCGTSEIATKAGVYINVGPDISAPTRDYGDINIFAIGSIGRIVLSIDRSACERYEFWKIFAARLIAAKGRYRFEPTEEEIAAVVENWPMRAPSWAREEKPNAN